MERNNPFHGSDQESDPGVEPVPPTTETQPSVDDREIETVPRSIWAIAGYILLISLLGFAAYSLIEQRKKMDAMFDELENRRAVIEQAESRALQSETRIITLNKNIITLTNEQQRLIAHAQQLEAAQRKLELEKTELIKARDEAAKIQDTLKEEMLAALESRDVTISELQGNLTLNILDRILFDSGRAIIKPEGEAVLSEIGDLLDQVPNRQIHVLGHTDNVPIRTSSYPSNWELSAARALAAVRFLVDDGGVDPKRIAAVAHGEFQPISSNSTPEGRARNRRITIVVLPEVFKTPEEPIEETDPAIESELVETSSELVPVEDTGPEIGTANDSREGLEQSTVDSPEPIPDQG